MTRNSASWQACLLCAALLFALPALNAANAHPRLMFGPHEVPALREKVQHEPWSLMYQRLKDDLWKDNQGRKTIDWTASTGELAWPGTRAAFLYVITGDDGYAAIAREVCRRTMDDPLWGLASTKGLTLYSYAYRVALMYDWCYNAPSWDTAFRGEVSLKLREMADLIVDNGGTEQNTSPASNWQGIRGAAAAWTYLAIDDPFDVARFEKAWNRVVTYLQQNLSTSADARGWNIEGLGYTYYPMGDFIGAYGYAQWRNDPTRDLRTVTPAAPWNYWTVYATSMHMPGQVVPVHPDWGDDNAAAVFSGTLGQAFWWLPKTYYPGMLYVYDMMVGPEGDGTWDCARSGTIWSILFHPGWEITQAEPELLPSWQDGYTETGGNGYVTWRRGTESVQDIVAQVYAKLRGNMGHSGPDGLGFRIIGLDNAWAVGGGRYGLKINNQDAYLHSMNSLYPVVPGSKLTISGDSGSFVGDPLVEPDGSGHAVMQVARSNLNVNDWTRRFATDHSGRSGADAVYVISDSSTNGNWWQLVTHEDNTITTDGNTFTITGVNGHRMEGTVLYPASVTFTTGTRIRGSTYNSFADTPSSNNDFIHFTSTDGDYLVVLTILRDGEPSPLVSSTGTWGGASPAGTVTIGPLSLDIDGNNLEWNEIRITAATSLLTVPEGGATVLDLALSGPPPAPVSISPMLLPEAGAEERFSIASSGLPLVFDASNWNVPQQVTVSSSTDADGLGETAHVRLYSDSVSALRPLDVLIQQMDAGPYPVVAFANTGGVVFGVPAGGKAANGIEVTLTAVPDPGFEFTGWSDGLGGASLERTFSIDSAISLEAHFQIAGRSSFEATADAYVRDGTYADTNYGTSTDLVVKHQPTAIGYNRQAFLRFPMPADPGDIGKATLLLTLTGLSDPGAMNRVHVFTGSAWDESTATWNTRPSYGDYSATWQPSVIGATYEVDITAAVLAALADSQTSLDLAITSDGLTYSAYASRETSDSSKRPRLLLQENLAPPIYEEWAAAEWPDVDPSQRAPEADANGDSIPNLLTYLVGDHSGLPRLVPAFGGLKIEWHRRVGFNSASWSMQWALHPAGPWTLLPADATTAISTTAEYHTLRTGFPEGVDSNAIFFRLQVSPQ